MRPPRVTAGAMQVEPSGNECVHRSDPTDALKPMSVAVVALSSPASTSTVTRSPTALTRARVASGGRLLVQETLPSATSWCHTTRGPTASTAVRRAVQSARASPVRKSRPLVPGTGACSERASRPSHGLREDVMTPSSERSLRRWPSHLCKNTCADTLDEVTGLVKQWEVPGGSDASTAGIQAVQSNPSRRSSPGATTKAILSLTS